MLRHTEAFYAPPNGFYGIASIFPLLALMALDRTARVRSEIGLGPSLSKRQL